MAVRHEWAHAEFLSQRESLPEVSSACSTSGDSRCAAIAARSRRAHA